MKAPASCSAAAALMLFLLAAAPPALAQGEWDFSKHSVPPEEIRSGGPPRDGIPALTSPEYVDAGEADFMRPEEDVIGVFLDGIARAYPLRILSWHELVNDRFGDLPVLVSW